MFICTTRECFSGSKKRANSLTLFYSQPYNRCSETGTSQMLLLPIKMIASELETVCHQSETDRLKVTALVLNHQPQAPPSEFLRCYDNITLFSAFPRRQHHYSYNAEICRIKRSADGGTVTQNMMEATRQQRDTSRRSNIRKAFSLIMWKMQYFLFIEETHQNRKRRESFIF